MVTSQAMKKIKVLQLRYITTLVRTDEMVYKDDFSMNTYHKCDYCDNNKGTFMTCNICAKTWCAPNQHCYDSHFLNCKGIENDDVST
jgi:hypothetical protein